jgi:hypothetical protein
VGTGHAGAGGIGNGHRPDARLAATVGPAPGAGGDAGGRGRGELRPFPTVNLVELARAGVPTPELLCDGLLYRGGLHSLAGPPDSGKSTLLGWWVAVLLAAGSAVVLLDEESGREATVEKLLALGVDPANLERLAYIEFPSRRWDEADRRGLWALLAARRPALVGYDSAGALLSIAGKDEDRAPDVTPFYKLLLEASRQFHTAGVVLDHLGKDQRGGRYARGSGAKLATVDVAYLVDPVKPFSRRQSGLLKLTVTKDRRGYLNHEHDVRVEVEAGTIALKVATVQAPTDGDGLAPAARKVLAALGASPAPLTNRQIGDWIAERYPPGLKRTTIAEALRDVSEAGLVDQAEPGPRGVKYWQLIAR